MGRKAVELAKGFAVSRLEQGARFIDGRKAPESRKRKARAGARVALYLPPALLKALRLRCVEEERSLSDAAAAAIEAWMAKGP